MSRLISLVFSFGRGSGMHHLLVKDLANLLDNIRVRYTLSEGKVA